MIFLDILLYSAGGVIGTMHHLYFSGEPAEHMALGAVFSAAEVIPLTFLTVEAWSFLQLGARQESRSQTPFPHRWAVMFLVAVGFWNFLGAGIFGFLINLPIVSYYEIGTALTANHGHAAMMGVYGMLAVGLALFCLRYLIPADRWPERAAKTSFWSLNIGLAWMCFSTCCRSGSSSSTSRSTTATSTPARSTSSANSTNTLLEWLRFPGDVALHRRRGPAPALHLLARRPPPGRARDAGGAGGHPLHRRHRAGRGGRRPHEHRGDRCRGYAVFLLACGAAASTASAGTPTAAPAASAPRASPTTSDLDVWVCPEGEQLRRFGDRPPAPHRPLPGAADVCNACPAKDGCTDSDEGREVVATARSRGRTRRRAASTAASRWSSSPSPGWSQVVEIARPRAPLALACFGGMLMIIVLALLEAHGGRPSFSTPSGFPGRRGAASAQLESNARTGQPGLEPGIAGFGDRCLSQLGHCPEGGNAS